MDQALLDYCLGKGPKGRGFKMPDSHDDSYRRESEERYAQSMKDEASKIDDNVFQSILESLPEDVQKAILGE